MKYQKYPSQLTKKVKANIEQWLYFIFVELQYSHSFVCIKFVFAASCWIKQHFNRKHGKKTDSAAGFIFKNAHGRKQTISKLLYIHTAAT